MLTPGYTLTATERILPSMALDFTTGVLDPRITFTRALDTATRVNSSGFIEGINANLPRFDYDPVTLLPRGLLVEDARKNLFLQSNGFSTTATWLGQPVVGTAIAASGISPDGTNNAFLYVPSTGAVNHDIQQFISALVVTYTMSVYAKPSGYDFLYMGYYDGIADRQAYFNVSTGIVSSSSGSPSPRITPAGNSWYRCSITFTGAVGFNYFSVCGVPSNGGRSAAGNGTSGVLIYGSQLEAGAFATSYIPTILTALDRNADVAQITGSNFTSFYNAAEGSFYVIGSTLTSINTANPAFCIVSDGTNSNYMGTLADDSSGKPQFVAWNSGALQVGLDAAPFLIVPNVPYAVATAYKLNSFAMATNGATVKTNPTGTPPTVNRLGIGNRHGNGRFLNGHIKKINYWKHRITDAEVQAFSKL